MNLILWIIAVLLILTGNAGTLTDYAAAAFAAQRVGASRQGTIGAVVDHAAGRRLHRRVYRGIADLNLPSTDKIDLPNNIFCFYQTVSFF